MGVITIVFSSCTFGHIEIMHFGTHIAFNNIIEENIPHLVIFIDSKRAVSYYMLYFVPQKSF